MATHEDDLRDLLAQADPMAGREDPALDDGLQRTLRATQPGAADGRPQRGRRRWEGLLLGAASVAALALATATIAPVLLDGSSGEDSAATSASAPLERAPDAGLAGDDSAPDETAVASPDAATVASGEAAADRELRLVRNGSVLVGTDDVQGLRNGFVGKVGELGGRVTSESVVTAGSGGGGPLPAAEIAVDSSLPYPWYPTRPGIYLTVEVPAERFDESMAAARSGGEVVQLQQSSYDVGTQIADVDARIAALEASLATLTGLLDEATSISDVVALEAAITQRRAELDGLRAQQRDLADQTEMSRISVSWMSPDDARATVDPQPQRSWWESFLQGLADLWAWLGRALLIASPLLLAGAIIWWARRRRPGAAGAEAEPQP